MVGRQRLQLIDCCQQLGMRVSGAKPTSMLSSGKECARVREKPYQSGSRYESTSVFQRSVSQFLAESRHGTYITLQPCIEDYG